MHSRNRVSRPAIAATLCVGLALGLLAATGLLALSRNAQATADAVVENTGADAVGAAAIAAYQAREGQLQLQLAALNQARAEREAAYAGQLAELAARQAALAREGQVVEDRARALSGEIDTLHATRAARAATYAQQLHQAEAIYGPRDAEMSNRLAEINAKLTEADALLGR